MLRSGKSEAAKVIIIKDCAVEANYWQTWSIAQPLCDSRATCLFSVKFCVGSNCTIFCLS